MVGEREAAIHELIEEFIARGLLQPSTSNWSRPAFPVLKPPTNEWRMVVDYRWLDKFHRGFCLPTFPKFLNIQYMLHFWDFPC